MQYMIGLSWIQGVMVGIEFPHLVWKNIVLVLDLGIIRATFALKW